MIDPRVMLAGLLGASTGAATARPTVDDIFGHAPNVKKSTASQTKNTLRKRRWKIAKMSRKVNYQRNGTRG